MNVALLALALTALLTAVPGHHTDESPQAPLRPDRPAATP